MKYTADLIVPEGRLHGEADSPIGAVMAAAGDREDVSQGWIRSGGEVVAHFFSGGRGKWIANRQDGSTSGVYGFGESFFTALYQAFYGDHDMAQASVAEKKKDLVAWVAKSLPSIRRALPRHLQRDVDRIARIAESAALDQPKLLDCERASLAGSIIRGCQLGLSFDKQLGEAYLVPRNMKIKGQNGARDQWKVVCTLMPGYRGLVKLARQSGVVADVVADVVYERDEFDFGRSMSGDTLTHKRHLGSDRGKLVAAYAIVRFTGDVQDRTEVMAVDEIEKCRASSAAKDEGPWVTHYDRMCLKTVVRRICKTLPMSVDNPLAAAIRIDEAADSLEPEDNSHIIDAELVEAEEPDKLPPPPKRSSAPPQQTQEPSRGQEEARQEPQGQEQPATSSPGQESHQAPTQDARVKALTAFDGRIEDATSEEALDTIAEAVGTDPDLVDLDRQTLGQAIAKRREAIKAAAKPGSKPRQRTIG